MSIEKIHHKERMILLREKLGMNQIELATSIDEPVQSIRDVETLRKRIQVALAKKLETKYGVSFQWLLTGEGEMFPAASVHPGGKWDDVTEKILLLLKDMDLEKRREVLRYLEEKKLLNELLQERKENQT
jgi:transcriptional regulator with XRE-family HTH domain